MESLIRDYWHQIIAIIGLVVVAVKLGASVKELRKDVDDYQTRHLRGDNETAGSNRHARKADLRFVELLQ